MSKQTPVTVEDYERLKRAREIVQAINTVEGAKEEFVVDALGTADSGESIGAANRRGRQAQQLLHRLQLMDRDKEEIVFKALVEAEQRGATQEREAIVDTIRQLHRSWTDRGTQQLDETCHRIIRAIQRREGEV